MWRAMKQTLGWAERHLEDQLILPTPDLSGGMARAGDVCRTAAATRAKVTCISTVRERMSAS